MDSDGQSQSSVAQAHLLSMAQVKQEEEDENTAASHVANLAHSQHGPLPSMHGGDGSGTSNTGVFAGDSNVSFGWMKKTPYDSQPQPGMCKKRSFFSPFFGFFSSIGTNF